MTNNLVSSTKYERKEWDRETEKEKEPVDYKV